MKKSTTKRALLLSVVSLFMCFTMLIGTTYAWFTDSVTSSSNIIAAGTLDVELYHSNKVDTDEKVDEDTILFDDVTNDKWEPGAMAYEILTVKNAGNLALKYQLTLNAFNATVVDDVSFASMLKVSVVTDESFVYERANIEELTEWKDIDTLAPLSDNLAAEEEKTYGIIIWWQPSDNDNIFNMNNEHNLNNDTVTINVGVNLVATQLQAEKDSFGSDYDKDAIQPAVVGKTGATIDYKSDEVGHFTINVPIEAIANGVTQLNPIINPPVIERDIPEDTTTTIKDKYSFDMSINGIKEDNTTPIKVTYVIPGNEDYVGVEVYQYQRNVATDGATYDPATRTVEFYTTAFGNFDFIFDTGAKVIPATYTDDEVIAMLKDAAKNGAIIDGNGRTINLGAVAENTYALIISNNATFKNMTLTATGKGYTVQIDAKNKTVTMKNVTFQNNTGKALNLSNNAKNSVVLEDCTIKGGAFLHGSNVTFINCSFNKNMNMEDASNYTFKDCKFTAGSAITMNSKLTNITFENNTFSGTAAKLYKGMPQPVNVQFICNTYKTAIASPDSGVDYEGWKTNGAWIEIDNIKK